HVERVLEGCKFTFPTDITLQAVQDFLAGLGLEPLRPALPAGKVEFTRKEAAELLGVKVDAVTSLVSRWRLPARGKSKDRRYPRDTVLAIIDRTRKGMGALITGYLARDVKAFTRWLVKRKHLREDPLADLPGASTAEEH